LSVSPTVRLQCPLHRHATCATGDSLAERTAKLRALQQRREKAAHM